MKIIILLLISALPISGYCQSGGEKVIKIPGVSLEQLVNGFLATGYAIEKSESSMTVIVTHLKEAPQTNVAIQLRAKLLGGNVLLSGEYVENGKGPSCTPITNTGVPGSPCSTSWNILYSFAQSFNKPLELM